MNEQIMVDTPFGKLELIDWVHTGLTECNATLMHVGSGAVITWWNVSGEQADAMYFDRTRMSMWTDRHGDECGAPAIVGNHFMKMMGRA